jgi:hypothetical protein
MDGVLADVYHRFFELHEEEFRTRLSVTKQLMFTQPHNMHLTDVRHRRVDS